ncbi:MAG: winged helix-turn-helix domain-containing protein [Nanoarchaeota archaeon]|nr:winged helix-turn-helix domain-containing protein [Nanoarchaeota archaeon]MBU4086844.1 winged helix-turn-helix domain-containing protein [Nanoarchaeota archaeon]
MDFVSVKDFPEGKTYVLLSKNYRKNLISHSMNQLNCKNYFELSIWINKKLKTKFNGGDVKYWIAGERLDERTKKIHPKFMPLSLVLELIGLNNEKIENLHSNIISYRSGGSGLVITAPILPIKITPELDSIVIHLFGDGAAGDFTPSYTQKNKAQVDNFVKKLENCFGKFEKSVYLTQGKYQLRFPKAITDILSKYYSIESYRSHDSDIPARILNSADKKRKLACIVAFIVDEGNVRDVISVYSVNKKLINGIRELVTGCSYNCSKIQFNKKASSYLFTLGTQDIERFYRDVQGLSKEFSTCNLSFKEDEVKFIIERRTKKNPKNRKITEKLILDLLKDNNLSARQISKKISYAYCTVIHTLEKLLEEKIVRRTKTNNKTYIWGCFE